MRKTSVIIVVLAVIAGLSFTADRTLGTGAQATTANLQTGVVERGTIVATVNGTGSLVPQSRVNLTFRMAGRVARILVEEGEPVQTGEVLAELEIADLEPQMAQAQAILVMRQIQVEQVKKGTSLSGFGLCGGQPGQCQS